MCQSVLLLQRKMFTTVAIVRHRNTLTYLLTHLCGYVFGIRPIEDPSLW